VLDQPGSGAMLAELSRSNLLLMPLDQRGQWYRYHQLFRDMLLAGLAHQASEHQASDLASVLRRRAAAWCSGNGLPEEALEYSMTAGDVDAAARLTESLAIPAYRQGRRTTLGRWFGWLEDRRGLRDIRWLRCLGLPRFDGQG
jgi:LuxR family maltose regulon positive regulatory protein